MDRSAWWAVVHRVSKSWTWLKWLSMHIYMLIFMSIKMIFCTYSCTHTHRLRREKESSTYCFWIWEYEISNLLLISHSVMSDSLQPHGLQHTRLPCPSPTPRACSNSNPLSWWCHPTISFSVIPFSSYRQSFPAPRSFPVSWIFASGCQSTGASTLASVLPVNIQDWFPLELTGLVSLQSRGLSRVFSNTTAQEHQFFSAQPSLWSNSHIHTWLLEKP